MLLLAELPLQELFSEFHYLAPFMVLLLCGVGLPLPEEITLIGCGLLLHQGHVDFVTITLVCSTAILLGDSIPFAIGRRYGMSILRLGWLAKVLHPERFAQLERRFDEHGNWAIFTCRFLPGIRIPGYFMAGTLRMSYVRFVILDGLGVLISVPASIWAGKVFAGQVDKLRDRFADLHLMLAFAGLSLILFLTVRHWVRRGLGSSGISANQDAPTASEGVEEEESPPADVGEDAPRSRDSSPVA